MTWGNSAFLAIWLFVIGCSGETKSSEAQCMACNGGASGSGSTPPPAQAGARLTVSEHPNGSCPASSLHTSAVPALSDAPTTSDPGTRVVDGNGTEIQCTVAPGEAGFAFAGEILQNGVLIALSSGTLDSSGRGTATLDHADRTGATFGQQSCDVSALEIAAGHIWAEILCSDFAVLPPSGEVCMASGVFVFENCMK